MVEPETCIGYMNDNGICMLTTYCNNVPDEKRPVEERGAGHGNFERATWYIVSSISDGELFFAGEDVEEDEQPKKRRKKRRKKPPMIEVAPQPLVGGETDENGCIGSAGYEWCETLQKCVRSWEEPCVTPIPEPMIMDGMPPAPITELPMILDGMPIAPLELPPIEA